MVIQRSDPAATQFLNVDLDILSRTDLQPLVATLGEAVFVRFVGRVKRTYHISNWPKSPRRQMRPFGSFAPFLSPCLVRRVGSGFLRKHETLASVCKLASIRIVRTLYSRQKR